MLISFPTRPFHLWAELMTYRLFRPKSLLQTNTNSSLYYSQIVGIDQSLMGQMGPTSPPDLKPDLKHDMKPDMSLLNGNSMSGFSPHSGNGGIGIGIGLGSTGTPGSPGGFSQMSGNGGGGGMQHSITTSTSPGGGTQIRSPYPPNHPLSGSKHLCSICGDRASGKHYGVYR